MGGPGAAAPGAFSALFRGEKCPRRRQTSLPRLCAGVEQTRLRRVRADVGIAPYENGGINGLPQLLHHPREAAARRGRPCRPPLRQNRGLLRLLLVCWHRGAGRCGHRPLRKVKEQMASSNLCTLCRRPLTRRGRPYRPPLHQNRRPACPAGCSNIASRRAADSRPLR